MTIRERLAEGDEELLCADGFDDAILGICERAGSLDVVAYDRNKCIEILVERDGMDYEEAVEYFDFNVVGGYVGERTPVFITLFTCVPVLTDPERGAILSQTE